MQIDDKRETRGKRSYTEKLKNNNNKSNNAGQNSKGCKRGC